MSELSKKFREAFKRRRYGAGDAYDYDPDFDLFDVGADEIDRLNAWVADLQSGMYVNCVYCGHRYGPGETTPVSMADALKAHIAQCQQHPMSAVVKLLQECADDLADMIEGHYAATKDHPAMKMRYDRDIDPVIRARAEIAKTTGAKP